MQNLMFRLSETPGSIRWTGLVHGASNEEVCSGRLGLPATEIDELRAKGII